MGRGRKKEFDRHDVLVSATELFWQKGGYEATGLADLLGAMGIARQSLYSTFGDKASLFTECLRLYGDEILLPLVDELKAGGPGLTSIRNVFQLVERRGFSKPVTGCLLASTLASPPPEIPGLDQITRTLVTRLEKAFESAVERGQRDREIRRDIAARPLARALVGSLQGAALLQRSPGGRRLSSDSLKGVLALLPSSTGD